MSSSSSSIRPICLSEAGTTSEDESLSLRSRPRMTPSLVPFNLETPKREIPELATEANLPAALSEDASFGSVSEEREREEAREEARMASAGVEAADWRTEETRVGGIEKEVSSSAFSEILEREREG